MEIVNTIRKGQIINPKTTTFKTFYSLLSQLLISMQILYFEYINVTDPDHHSL